MALLFESILAEVVVLLVTCYVALRLYVAHGFTYWKKRGMPHVQATSVFGNMEDVFKRRENLSEYLERVYKNNAGLPCVGLFAMRKPVLMARDQDLLRCIFVKDAQVFLDRNEPQARTHDLLTRSLFMLTGRRWRELRIKLTPTFTSGKIKRMFHLVNECGKQLITCIEHETSKDSSVVVKEMIARYSTDVITSCAFGMNANALADPGCEFRTTMKRMMQPRWYKRIAYTVILLLPQLRRFLNKYVMDYSVYDYLSRTFWEVVDYRGRNNEVRNDFVDLLTQIKKKGHCRAEDSKELEEIERDSMYMDTASKTEKHDLELEDNDIVAQAFIFILAGFETSASVVTYTLYELARHLDIQERLRREIRAVLEKHNNEVTYDAIAEMTYLDMVVSETMRKYPTLPVLERLCLSDYKIPGTKFTIEKGTKVMIPVRAIHYDPDIYPDPERFDPERFSAENKKKRSNFAHLPFGEGPRICIGMRFGQVQVKTALVHIISSFQVKPCPDTPQPPLEMRPGGGILTPKQDIVLAFVKLQ